MKTKIWGLKSFLLLIKRNFTEMHIFEKWMFIPQSVRNHFNLQVPSHTKTPATHPKPNDNSS